LQGATCRFQVDQNPIPERPNQVSNYIADKKYNGTLERSISLTLAHHLIAGPGEGFVLRDPVKHMDGLTDALALTAREHGLNPEAVKDVVNCLEASLPESMRMDADDYIKKFGFSQWHVEAASRAALAKLKGGN
jgi:hypothetical protein